MSDVVEEALLRHMGKLIENEVGSDVVFAVFVDWRDGPPSYLSNGDRRDVTEALAEWLDRTAAVEPPIAETTGAVPPLEAKCAEIGQSMHEEDIDVTLFLFTIGDNGQTAWFSTMPNGRRLVEQFVEKVGVQP